MLTLDRIELAQGTFRLSADFNVEAGARVGPESRLS